MIHVLYIDDEEALLDVCKLFLERSGDMVLDTTTSVKGAKELMVKTRYDAIVSDYQMPGINGIQFLKEMRSRADLTPFILFTGKGREEVVIEALNSGADFYLQKGGNPMAQSMELEFMVKEADRRLLVMDGITRHDTLNKLMALQGFIDLERIGNLDAKRRERLDGMERIVRFLRDQAHATWEHQNIGSDGRSGSPCRRSAGGRSSTPS